MAVADRIARLQAELATRTGAGGGAGIAALQARLAALQGGSSLPAAAPAAGKVEALAAPPGMTSGPNSQAGVQPGFYRTANGQIIPIAQGLVSPAVYNAYRAANPQLDAVGQQMAALEAKLAAGAAAHQQNMQNAFGYLLTPENLAALGMNPATTADQLTNLQINALTRANAQPQIAGQVGATNEQMQAFALTPEAQAQGYVYEPVPQAGGIDYQNPVPAGWTPEMAAEVAQPAGVQPITPDMYAAQNPGLNPNLLDQWRRAYLRALAQYQNPAVPGAGLRIESNGPFGFRHPNQAGV